MNVDIEHILELIARYSYWVIFLGLLLENAILINFLVPGVTLLFITGFLIQQGVIDLLPALLCAFAGTVLGDNMNYALGRWGMPHFPWVRKVLEKNPRAIAFIKNQPTWLYTFFQFPGILRPVVPLILGSILFPIGLWIFIDIVGTTLFIAAYLSAGYITASASGEMADGESAISFITLFFTVLVIGWGIGMLIKSRPWRRSKEES